MSRLSLTQVEVKVTNREVATSKLKMKLLYSNGMNQMVLFLPDSAPVVQASPPRPSLEWGGRPIVGRGKGEGGGVGERGGEGGGAAQ